MEMKENCPRHTRPAGRIPPRWLRPTDVDRTAFTTVHALTNSLNSGRKTEVRRLRAFSSLTQLPRYVLDELASDDCYQSDDLSFWADGPPICHWQRWRILEKLSKVFHIYVVTQSLAYSESALDDLSVLIQGAKKIVLPIFHGVDPSDVRYQTGTFAEAFEHHEKKYKDDPQKVKRWRAALTKLANLSGWHSKGRSETKLIRAVVDKVQSILCSPFTRPGITNVPSKPSRTLSSRRKHDVFLSFRGKDTRLNFMEHLYAALIQKGISTFKDDIDLEKGEDISTQLVQAIERSKVSVVIVSPDYASSEWCLDELLKILECRNASKVGMKKEMKTRPEYEEQAHTPVIKGKASLRNMENNISRNRREMDVFTLGVNYGGKWVGSAYSGGRTEEVVSPEDITYDELLDILYQIVGVDPNEDEIIISTIDDSKSPANFPVEITNDNDLTSFINKNLSSEMHLKHPLGNSSTRTEVKVLVNHDGEWVNSTYIGGKTKGIIIPDDITYQELVNRVYGVVEVDPNEYKLIMKTIYESNLPTQPVEITDDEALAFFIHEFNSLGMSSILTLCTTLEPRACPNGRMESSQSSDAATKAGSCPSCVHCVTPDQVPHLHTQVGRSSPNIPCMSPPQQQSFYQQQHFHQQTSQPWYQQYQPSLQQPQPPYQQLHPYYMHPQSQYQQSNPSYMQPLSPPINQVPYSLKMFWNDATRIFQNFNFWQFCFVIIVLVYILIPKSF